MDVIPSLCASSASCAIGAVGYALAQSSSTNHNRQSDRTFNTASSSLRPTSSITSPTPSYHLTIPPTRPGTSSRSPDLRKRASLPLGFEEEGEKQSLSSKGQFSRPQTSRTNEDPQKRSSWYRRFSIISSSVDGSGGSPSIIQPSTPSVFSNGSSATPFFNQPINTVTPRNKLVKRSTSHRGLPTEYPVESTFASIGRVPTFRRPATSHQRSETLRLQSAKQNLPGFTETADLYTEDWSGRRNRISVIGNTGSSSSRWRPFFRYQERRLPKELGSRRSSNSTIFGGPNHITTVVLNTGEHALLVQGNRVDRPKMDYPRQIDPLVEEETNYELQGDNTQDQVLRNKKTRHSISNDTRSPNATPQKPTRGSSLKQLKGRDGRSDERRIVSAPLQRRTSHPTRITSAVQEQSSSSSPPSSPPRIETLSAFGVEIQRPSSSNRGSMGFDDSFSNIDVKTDEVHSFTPHRIQPSLALRSGSGNGSRVPSDKSTGFGSDNETNRVFSVDGDETDHRSETVYDSLRTDASGSSHSGARHYRAEHLFGEHKTQESSELHQKLAGVSLSANNDEIIEEEESINTPVRHARPSADHTASFSSLRNSATKTRSTTGNEHTNYSHELELGSSDEESWDDELGINSSERVNHTLQSLNTSSPQTDAVTNTTPQKSNIFEWSEPPPVERNGYGDTSTRPKTSHPQQDMDRGGRPAGRRITNGFHTRSQSVPLPPDNSKHKFNNAKKLDNWMLGNKGVSEDWDNDFDFDEGVAETSGLVLEDTNRTRPISGIVVPREILERQATVHGQFGQVKELTLLVEQLRRLYHSATTHGILDGQSSELWKEAAGIIDLATLDEEEPEAIRPSSPASNVFEINSFDDDSIISNSRRLSNAQTSREATHSGHTSPGDSKHRTPDNRPRHDSVARAKDVLVNIHQRRDPMDPPLEIDEESVSPTRPKKMPFDTTSLRDLVTRAGVVTRACKEIIRRIEDPDYVPNTPERRPTTPPDPPFFNQIFQNSPVPSVSPSDRRSPRAIEKVPFPSSPSDHKVHGHNVSMMTVV